MGNDKENIFFFFFGRGGMKHEQGLCKETRIDASRSLETCD